MTKHAGVGMHRQYDPLASTIGLITGFANNADSPTGFQVHMLVRGVERTFDVSETAYSIQFSDDYFPYPPLGERIFMAQFADDGTVVELVDVNDFLAEGNPIKTACMIGTYKMFEYQITEETPRIGEILKVQGARVVFVDYNKHAAAGAIRHVSYGGRMPAPGDGVSFRLAPDVDVYTWDWTTSLAPFSRCSREEARAKRFPTRAFVGCLGDLERNCYWAGFYSTRGDEEECDLVKCFLNAPPGWE